LTQKHNSVSPAEYENKFESTYQEVPVFEENESDQWMNRCVFECKECETPKHFNTRGKVSLHLFKDHNMIAKAYLEKHKTLLKSKESYTCQVCDKQMRWDSENIKAHLDRFHQLSPEKYVSEILNNDLETHLATFKTQTTQISSPNHENGSPKISSNGSPSSNWLNKCHFDCHLCSFEANNYSVFLNHLKTAHNVSGKDYLEKKGGKMCSTVVKHTCQICGFILDWDRTNISKHMHDKHNSISLQAYTEKYEKIYTDFPDIIEAEADQWMNQSTFQCKECDEPKNFNTRNKLMLHLFKDHQLSMKAYLEKEKQIISTLVNHTCKICDKIMRWDSDTLIAHLDRFHSVTPQNYFDNFLKDDFENVLLAASTKKLTTSTPPSNPSSESSSHVKACPTIKWNDKCSFLCQICYTVVPSKNKLKWHLHSEHKMTEVYYSDHFTTDSVFEKVSHGCLICGEELLFDSQIMAKHLTCSHDKMTVATYKADYFDKYVFPEEDRPKDIDNEWTYKSLYNCNICLNLIKGKDQFKKHLSSEHSTSFNQYSETHGCQGIFEEHFHTCLVEDKQGHLCSKKVLWDGRSMAYHFGKHNLTPEEYHSINMLQDVYTKKMDKIVETVKEEWTNKCTFLCKICSKVFKDKSQLVRHLKEDHDEALFDGDDVIVDYKLHTCQICSENVLWEDQTLKTHLKDKHNNTPKISEYGSKHLPTYQENEDCKKEMEAFDSWINQCVYQCLLCPTKVTMDRRMRLQNHLSKKHSNNRTGYFADNEEKTFVQKVEHVCQICSQTLLWDSSYLKRHIENSHKMKASIYRAKYMARYAESLH
jgi:hypothetical protein